MLINRASMISFLLIVVLIFPTFGGIWGEQHVVFLFFLFSVMVLASSRPVFQFTDFFPVAVLMFLQFLLLISWWGDFSKGSAAISDLPSALRPTALIFFYLAFLSLILSGCHTKVFNKFIVRSTIILSIFFVTNVIFDAGAVFRFLYFPYERFRDSAFISVFATTYFAVYFYYIIFLFSLCRLFIDKFSLKWLLVFLASIVFVFFSQGKAGYLSVIFTLFLLFFIKSGAIGRLTLVSISIFSVFSLLSFNKEIASYLSSTGYFSLYQMSIFVDKGLDFGNAALRLQQFYDSFQGSLERNLFGVGLGRDVYLESYLASFTYRYGVIGFSLYNIFYFSLVLFATVRYRRSTNIEHKVIYGFCGLWFFNIPILMLSNPMFEMGKNSIFSMFILASLFGANRLFGCYESSQRHESKFPQLPPQKRIAAQSFS